MHLGRLASVIGKGLTAGTIGTAAMTLSSTIEMKLRGREASDAPARVASMLLGVEPRTEADKQRLSTVVHWGYGKGWGVVRGILGAAGMKGMPATLAHFGLVWGTELVVLPMLEVSSPASEWPEEEVAIDAWHHFVYAAATGIAYELLDRQ